MLRSLFGSMRTSLPLANKSTDRNLSNLAIPAEGDIDPRKHVKVIQELQVLLAAFRKALGAPAQQTQPGLLRPDEIAARHTAGLITYSPNDGRIRAHPFDRRIALPAGRRE